MSVAEAKYRRPLNEEQRTVLNLLFRFRFIMADQFANYFDKPGAGAVQKRLQILEVQGYIAKRYDGSYKLAGRPAEYYLLPKGAKFLQTYLAAIPAADRKTKLKITDQDIKTRYKDKTASQAFIRQSIVVFSLSLKLHDTFGDKLSLLPKANLKQFEYIVRPLPDAYIFTPGGSFTTRKHWYVDVYEDDIPLFVIIRRIKKYIRYYQDDEWPNDNPPAVLFLLRSDRRQKQVHRRIVKELNDAYLDEDDILFATSTLRDFFRKDLAKDKIWHVVDDAKSMKRLSSLF